MLVVRIFDAEGRQTDSEIVLLDGKSCACASRTSQTIVATIFPSYLIRQNRIEDQLVSRLGPTVRLPQTQVHVFVATEGLWHRPVQHEHRAPVPLHVQLVGQNPISQRKREIRRPNLAMKTRAGGNNDVGHSADSSLRVQLE